MIYNVYNTMVNTYLKQIKNYNLIPNTILKYNYVFYLSIQSINYINYLLDKQDSEVITQKSKFLVYKYELKNIKVSVKL